MVELIWEGKYDAQGRRVAPLKIALPFQTVESVNESAQLRQRQFDLFSTGRDPEWRNRLIWGDKKYVLPSLLEEFAGKVDLIYIDPPFDTGADFSFNTTIPDNPDTDEDESVQFTKQPSMLELKAYRDTWGRGLDSFLQWFQEAVAILHELLADHGTLFVHLDWRVVHYAKVVLDLAFGRERFIQEIVWQHQIMGGSHGERFPKAHETLLWYAKSPKYAFVTGDPKVRVPFSEYVRTTLQQDEAGKWFYTRRRMSRKATLEEKEAKAHTRTYVDDVSFGTLASDVWTDMPSYQPLPDDKTGYPTQKPSALLERVISAGSNPGDLVLDCFAGSGTTAAVAEKLGRRYITADLGRFAIHTTRKRLLSIPNVKPFVVQNLGKYERQAWQASEFGETAEARQHDYRTFILDLYRAEAAGAYRWLHGMKSLRWVHVGAVDSPVSTGDLTAISNELRAAGAGRVDILGWDFAFNTNQDGKQMMERAGIDVRFLVIPREVLEKKAVEQGDIVFFELGALGVEITQPSASSAAGLAVRATLTDFIVRLDNLPEDVRSHITHWSQMLDYWAIDWDYRGDAFHNQWQSYRTRKEPKLELSATHEYPEPGDYRVMVKAIDILGNDTTRVLDVSVPLLSSGGEGHA